MSKETTRQARFEPQPQDPELEVLTTRPHTPPLFSLSVMYIIYENLKKKLLRPDYFQIQFVEKIFTLLFNTEIIYRDQTLIKFVY